MAVSKADIAAQFNSIVRNGLSGPAAGAAPWYQGNVSGGPAPAPNAAITGHNQLGPQAEPAKTAGNIPGVAVTSASVFNVLHGFAMELTRVRRTQYVFFYSTSAAQPANYAAYATNTAALKPYMAIYFPIPGGQVEPGTVMTMAQLNAFLNNLRATVQSIRTSNSYLHTIAACHTSCHGSCHGSRGRR